jgi:sporulation protein YlmC with PRC-barrel domain
VLSACASNGAEQTPGPLGTEPLGTETGLATATEVIAPTEAATTAATEAVTVAASEAATVAATSTTVAQATTEVETGIVAMPYSMFTVASVTGMIGSNMETGTQVASTQPAGTQAAGTGTQPATTGTQTVGGMETDTTAMLVRASELLGSQVVDMNGDTVGDVTDVLVNDTGVIQYVIVDANDFLQDTGTDGTSGTGTGTQVAGTPAPVGTLDNSTQVVGTIEPAGTAAAGTPEAIATSTVGEGTAMPGTAVVADEDTVLIFNGTAADIRDQGIMLPQALMDDDGVTFDLTGGDAAANLSQLDGLLRVSNLTDDQVVNANDDDLGQVEDWIVDLRQGMLQFGVVDFGGFLGIAENTVAVPWDQFTISASGDNNLMLDVTEDTLRNAPQLDMSDWQPWPNPLPNEWVTETQTFWETAG